MVFLSGVLVTSFGVTWAERAQEAFFFFGGRMASTGQMGTQSKHSVQVSESITKRVVPGWMLSVGQTGSHWPHLVQAELIEEAILSLPLHALEGIFQRGDLFEEALGVDRAALLFHEIFHLPLELGYFRPKARIQPTQLVHFFRVQLR